MINQIANSVDKKVFAPLQTSGVSYAIAKPFTEVQQQELKKEEDKKGDKLGAKITKIALGTGLILFLVLKGTPRKWRSKLDQFYKNHVDRTLLTTDGKADRIRDSIIRTLAKGAKAIFNLAPLKDILVAKALEKSKPLSKVGDKITNYFEKISVGTSRRAYNKTMVNFDKLFAKYDKVNNMKDYPNLPVFEINTRIATVRKYLIAGFSETEQNRRIELIKKRFDGIDNSNKLDKSKSLKERVWAETFKNLGKFITKDYDTFVSERLAAKEKFNNWKKITIHKTLISNDLDDICENTYKLLIYLDTFVKPTHLKERAVIKKIANKLKDYKKVAEKSKDAREILINGGIKDHLDELEKVIVTENLNKYPEETTKQAKRNIKYLKEIYEFNPKGEIQKILDIYKKSLTKEEYAKLKKDTYNAVYSLNDATEMEADKLFDKIRDLKIGSAPKDTIAVLASLGIVGYGLSKAENKEERTSVAIKYGVPTVGAVMIAVYCTVGLISAGPSLLIGLASGLAMNQIGTSLDKIRKKYKEKPLKLNDISIPTSILPSKNKNKQLIQDKSTLQPTNKSGS